ncbi:MAG: OmpH family outer membrane protein [Pirellulaceae bacterium]
MTQRIAMNALVCLIAVFAAIPSSHAQSTVAIVDIGVIFDSHAHFKQELQSLRSEAESLQMTVNQQRQKLAQDSESLALKFNPGSEQYKSFEKDLALAAAKLDVDSRDKMRELMQREAHVHFDTYEEVNKYIEQYCQENQIRLVLRYSGGEMKADDPDSIMNQINGAVVFFRPERDITQEIVARMANAKDGAMR